MKALEWLKIDLNRITFAISERDFEEETVLWIVPAGAKYPKYVDGNYKTIKGRELKEKINELFPRK